MSIEVITSTNGQQSLTKELPVNVNSEEQLALLPEKYLSDDPKRPLLLTTLTGKKYKYALRPVVYSVLAILIVECLERLTYYGIANTETEFLTGDYDPKWNANMSDANAVSYTSASVAIAYTAPFIGGIIADGFIGDYWGIILGVSVFYIPGLFLISLTTFPGLLGSTFNTAALSAGLLALMPIGTGFIKSIVNVFGAKQFHPLLQAAQIESYYVNFYVAINIGALVGGIIVPILAQRNLEVAYLVPLISMCIGLLVFLGYSKRFVKREPEKTALFNTLKLVGKKTTCKKFDDSKESKGGNLSDDVVDGVKRLLQIIPVCLLILPFNVVYSQMTTVFILQGQAMKAIGVFDPSMMSNFDAISVLVTGVLTGSYLYPALEKRGFSIPLSYRFAIGSFFGALAIASALIVDAAIASGYINSQSQISIFWQIGNYIFIGIGEIFAVSTSYEAAFTIAPKEQKGLASAINLFLGNGLASFVCIGLSQALASWFPVHQSDPSSIQITQDYVDSDLRNYLWVLFGIIIFGVIVNMLPPIKNWVEQLRGDALDATAMDLSKLCEDDDSTPLEDIEGDVSDDDCSPCEDSCDETTDMEDIDINNAR